MRYSIFVSTGKVFTMIIVCEYCKQFWVGSNVEAFNGYLDHEHEPTYSPLVDLVPSPVFAKPVFQCRTL